MNAREHAERALREWLETPVEHLETILVRACEAAALEERVACVMWLEAEADRHTFEERQLLLRTGWALVSERGERDEERRADEKRVPRGHCNRCEFCGWALVAEVVDGCVANNCSMRPRPERRTHCAGCGARYEDG